MSSREDVKKWMTFCNHMREAIIDEQKAVPDYEKLQHEARELIQLMSKSKIQDMSFLHTLHSEVGSIISDEERHAEILMPLFDRVCPRMAFHRKGVEELPLKYQYPFPEFAKSIGRKVSEGRRKRRR